MKTKWMIIPVVALALGCSREIDTNVTYIDGEFTLYATSGENDTRTVLQQDGRVFWSPSDCITVFYGNVPGMFTSTNTEPAASAEFTGSLGSFAIDGETEFRAIYPHSNDIVTPTDEGILSIFLPSEQTGVEGTFADDLFICVAKSKDVNLHFYNVCGGVKFSLARGDIKKVVFRGNNGETLAGRMAVEFDSKGIPQVTDMTGGKSSVTLVAPDGGTFKEGAYYYLVLVPQSLTKGYTMELWTDELVETVSSQASVTVRRSAWGVLEGLGATSSTLPDAVDLGLSVKWASFNLGASKPEEGGDYYAWGETEAKNDYEWSNYKWCNGSYTKLTKYNTNGNYGIVDNKTQLDPEDDVAMTLLGDKWRMPTDAEIDELIQNCTWTWDTKNGVNGYWVTSKVNTSAKIFLPAAGYHDGSGIGLGYYWSSTIDPEYPNYANLLFISADDIDAHGAYRCFGQFIRPVYGEPVIPVESITIDKTEMTLSIGETSAISATVHPDNATNKKVSWSSSDEAVATVSPNGVVTGVAVGSAIITVKTSDGGKTATCSVTVRDDSPSLPVPEMVDLGLSVKWASFNLGATKPEEFGDYYAWGEAEPYYVSTDPLIWKEDKSAGYAWQSYRWCMGTNTTLTKYCTDASYGNNGFTDNKNELDPDDDAAHMHLGGSWFIPTDAQWTELRENCTFTEATMNGISGFKVSSLKPGYTHMSIFLPGAGYGEDTYIWGVNSDAIYWSSSTSSYPCYAWVCGFSTEMLRYAEDRRYGHTIRPVYRYSYVAVETVSLDKSELELPSGETYTLSATILPGNATSKVVTWSSSDESVAMVSLDGMVTGLSAGSAIITVTTSDGGKTAICKVTVKGNSSTNIPVPVDLGLSVKWASFNLGATKPEEFGDYYAWGETEPYYQDGGAQSENPIWKEGKESGYSWASYKWCMGGERTMTKYCTLGYWGYNGFVDGKKVLDLEDDAAYVNLGGKWRMPTVEELEELQDNCSWEVVTENGVSGKKVTGPNGNYIFLPASGYRDDSDFNNFGDGCYWSSSIYSKRPHYACYLLVGPSLIYTDEDYRCLGYSIRPVYDDR